MKLQKKTNTKRKIFNRIQNKDIPKEIKAEIYKKVAYPSINVRIEVIVNHQKAEKKNRGNKNEIFTRNRKQKKSWTE